LLEEGVLLAEEDFLAEEVFLGEERGISAFENSGNVEGLNSRFQLARVNKKKS
jgi:hypothetical protein